ncbi:NAD-dependent epimerase/dehydratase family protein [Candidatus Leptofilum sp.]|uniref:NAD-dependent epimerase/dehydratase family protein n=1 Tax=Candidatus Leptofilum sp. TaxID=3241576 RepID=UPI003B598FE6
MKIAVTGAAGFIGSHLAEALVKQGHEVVGIDNFANYYSAQLKQANAEDIAAAGVTLHRLDLAEDDLSSLLADVEFVFHLAGQPGISATVSLADYMRNNVVVADRLLTACQQQKSLRCFVNVSTSSVYGRHAYDPETEPPKPTSYYGVTKLAAEQLALAAHREKGFPACSLRIFSVYGPRERPEKLYPKLIRSILTDTPFPLFEGSENHSRSYTFVGDIIEGFVSVLERPENVIGEIINLGSDVEMTTGQGIGLIEEIMGKKAKLDIRPKRPGDQLHTCANIGKARELLGYAPHTQLADGLEAEVDWYVNRIYANGLHNV